MKTGKTKRLALILSAVVAVVAVIGSTFAIAQSPADEKAGPLQGLVDDGTINQEQADAVRGTLKERFAGKRGFGPRRHGPGKMHLAVAAEAIGITPQELREELSSDKVSLADVANNHDVDPQTVIDALVAELKTKLAAAVDNERITQEEADEKLATATEKITERVHTAGAFGCKKGPRGPAEEGTPAEETSV